MRPERPVPADLAARSEVVFFLLGDLDQIEAQLTGPSGFEAGVHSPTIAVIATALAPEGLRSLAHRVAERTAGRLRLVDAPLSGPRSAVLRGELSIAVGAASSAYPGIEPVLSLLGPCLRVGGIGSAQVAHACEQLMVAAAAVGLGEAILVAERSGLDVDALLANWRRTDAAGRLLDAAREQTEVAGGGAGAAGRRWWPARWRWAPARRTASACPLRCCPSYARSATGWTTRAWETRISAPATGPGPQRRPGRDQPEADRRRPVPGRRKAASPSAAPACRGRRSGQLQDDDHQDDDHQHTDDGADQSPVHTVLLSRSRPRARVCGSG